MDSVKNEVSLTGVPLALAVADVVPDLVCLCINGEISWLNAAGALMIGLASTTGLNGQPVRELLQHDYRTVLDDGLASLVQDEAIPLMFQRCDGAAIETEIRVQPLAATALEGTSFGALRLTAEDEVFVLYARDLTKNLRAVKDILESENRYRSLVNLALNFICIVDRNGLISLLNEAGQTILEAPGGTLLNEPVRRVVHADYLPVIDLGLDVLASEDGLVPMKFVSLSGEGIDAEMRVTPLERNGSYMLEARDIRARLRSAEAVREREQRLQGILDTVAEGIISADEQGTIQSFNRAAEKIFGHRAQDVVGKNLRILMPEPNASHHDSYLQRYLSHASSSVLGQGRELEGLRKDGSIFPLELNIAELHLGKNRLFTGIIRDITFRRQAEDAQRRYKEELEQTVEIRTRDLRRLSHQTAGILKSAGDGIIGVDNNAVITFANPAAELALGYASGSLLGQPADEVFRVSSQTEDAGQEGRRSARIRAALRRGMFFDRTELMLVRQTGDVFAAEFSFSPINDEGERTGAVVVFRDISERKAAEERLSVAATVFETTAEGIFVVDLDGHISMANVASTRITGWTGEQCLGRLVQDVLFPTNPFSWGEACTALMDDGRWELEMWSNRRDGEEYAARLACSLVRDEGGLAHRIVLVINDITQRKRDEERIRFQANYDMLTGLPNRTLFHDRLEVALANAHRLERKMALMFIDLDGFKAINDTLGHDAGDILLRSTAGRLRSCVRESDTVARLGGDEFTVIMSTVEDAAGAAIVAQRIIDSLTDPFDLSSEDGPARSGRVSASIGIALLPEHGHTADDILRHADLAMYDAKAKGKANYQFFRIEMEASH